MSLYCHGSPDCGPARQSPEFSLLHNHAAAAQTWGLAATASIGKPTAAATSASLPSTTGSLAAAKTAGAAVTATGTATATATATARASSGGLSAGTKAGIGIGLALGFVVVLAALWFCVARARRRRGTLWDTATDDGLGAPKTMMMMMGEGQDAVSSGWDGEVRHEMGGEGKVNELQGTPQAELSSVASPVRYGLERGLGAVGLKAS